MTGFLKSVAPIVIDRASGTTVTDIHATSNDVAAFIAELVMGEGGIIVPPFNYFKEVKKVLDHYGILFIADEVQSGFARTGKMFAIEYYGIESDILVTAKGIAGGFPLSAFTSSADIAAAYKPGDHLSTFGGNPVCCAAVLANIEFLEKENLPARATETGNYAMAKLRESQKKNSLIGEVRGLGLLIGVGGVSSNVVRFQPPLVIMQQQLDRALAIFTEALQEVAQPAYATA